MGEPWLDSLSEDWNSEPHLSSPASSVANSKYGTRKSYPSESRIPHLARSMRQQSSSGSFLKPRSSRGIAKSKGIPVLSERSASSLNLPGSTSHEESRRKQSSSIAPRRTSSNFSDSQQSVQHHTIHIASEETPEWKKRIHNGEDIASDGFDLFSPSKLEGMFAQPLQSTPDQENLPTSVTNDTKPWTSLKFSNEQPTSDQYQILRSLRSRVPPMEPLPEMNEDCEDSLEYSMSAISSDLIRDGSIRGLVKRRVSNLEQTHKASTLEATDLMLASHVPGDPRWRTLSGQLEIRNEVISPVTASTKNTISAKAVMESIELDPAVLKSKLMEASSERHQRPSSRSSDRDVSYSGQGYRNENLLHEESLQDITSHSLPEDLSMGTQDFTSQGGYINSRRGPGSNEPSFCKKKLSSVNESSQIEESGGNLNKFRSSPPPYDMSKNSLADQGKDDASFSTDQGDASVVHHEMSTQRPTSAGSPLKLFGNRDTYTNNKLLRVLTQFEEARGEHARSRENNFETSEEGAQAEHTFRMSQFGQGELDTYSFEKEVTRPSPVQNPVCVTGDRLFQSFTNLSIDDESTIAGVKQSKFAVQEQNAEDPNVKRTPSSPTKDRTPKRRRTLLRDEIVVDGVDIEIKVDHVQENVSLAGKKRKDARPGEGGAKADPQVLASRSILQPKSGTRRVSSQSQHQLTSQNSSTGHAKAPNELTEALAAELASFAQGLSEGRHGSRKPSLATRDYMEEANKVMEFIRARGKPKPQLSEIQEPVDSSEIDADRILDLEIEDESTIEPFSRPPSREGPVKPREDRRAAKHDLRTASHLRKFKDSDDLELLASTSAIGTLHLVDNQLASEAACVPIPHSGQQSSPPNIRILGHRDTPKKRRHSPSTIHEHSSTAHPSESSSHRTIGTEASNSSGQKGMITSGTVSIPDNVGVMTFDHEKQIWVKQHLAQVQREKIKRQERGSMVRDELTLEDDPFLNIPDLSIDEQHEAAIIAVPNPTTQSSTADTVAITRLLPSDSNYGSTQSVQGAQHHSQASNQTPIDHDDSDFGSKSDTHDDYSLQQTVSMHSEASKHEERLHQGILSRAPASPGTTNLQPRVVTIAFSSPIASQIPQPPLVESSAPISDDEDVLPPEDLEDDLEYLKTPQSAKSREQSNSDVNSGSSSRNVKHQLYRSMTLNRRPVSRIEERDEEQEHNIQQHDGLSLVHLNEAQMTTPASAIATHTVKAAPAYKGTSILCLTPLSEFTVHQADKVNHPDESFVQARAHPKALLQAHGSLALSVDMLIKAITDAVPNEPFWEQLRKLDLTDSRLQSVYGLSDYCSGLEVLDMSHNQVSQLDGLPSTLRHLVASNNKVNDFTSWGHLQNLQYLDVSNNQLENLEGFASLVHVRRLKACGNNIKDIEGVLDLDGLISLNLQQNHLGELDFEGVDLPRLEELDVSNNDITIIRNLPSLPRLKSLNLSGNDLNELCIAEPLEDLKTLIVSDNKLETLDLAMLPALTELDLDDNCIKIINGLPEASQLRKLSVRNQRDSINIVEFVLTTPNECNEILLSSNVLPEGQLKLPRYPHYNLRQLEMAACGLRSLPIGFGDYFPNCRSLNFNFNALPDLSPLLGIIKLQRLLVAGNRIKRLRRTCLILSRMPVLERVDLRSNPLTIGFYAPDHNEQINNEAYILADRTIAQDSRWLQRLDDTTALRRKMIELLLLEGCRALKELDGLTFNKEDIKARDAIWDRLTSRGVLMKAIEAPPQRVQSLSAVEMPVGDSLQAGQVLDGNDVDDINMKGLGWERSLTVE